MNKISTEKIAKILKEVWVSKSTKPLDKREVIEVSNHLYNNYSFPQYEEDEVKAALAAYGVDEELYGWVVELGEKYANMTSYMTLSALETAEYNLDTFGVFFAYLTLKHKGEDIEKYKRED